MSNFQNNLIGCNMQIWEEVKKHQLFGSTKLLITCIPRNLLWYCWNSERTLWNIPPCTCACFWFGAHLKHYFQYPLLLYKNKLLALSLIISFPSEHVCKVTMLLYYKNEAQDSESNISTLLFSVQLCTFFAK